MSVLGVVLRIRPEHLETVLARLVGMAGVDISHNPGDGRLVLVMEDVAEASAAAQLGAMALWPDVLGTSLVYEYSGPDAPAPLAHHEAAQGWRTRLTELDTPIS
nr:chaperone NapD [uncultured Roseateles sp.]